MIVGEAPGAEEEQKLRPFVGASGQELDRMLGLAGISPSDCFYTNVARVRPPNNNIDFYFARTKKQRTNEHTGLLGRWVTKEIMDGYNQLQREIKLVSPNIIIPLGNTALWAVTGRSGISDWRGSQLECPDPEGSGRVLQVIPTYHPANVLRNWSQRWIVIHDLRRAARYIDTKWSKPDWKFTLRPTYEQVTQTLRNLIARAASGPFRLSFDIETDRGHITCAGLAWSRTEALCIPFTSLERSQGYWDADREFEIINLLRTLLTHPHCDVIGQNIIYDSQYTWKHWWFVPRVVRDTMITWHSIYSDVPKSLDFQASILCPYYQYWKREGKEYLGLSAGEDTDWFYNCLDCVYTYEIDEAQEGLVNTVGIREVSAFQNSMFYPVLNAMQTGVRVDTKRRAELVMEVQDAVSVREQFLIDTLGHPLNPDSPKQMHGLFYGDFKLPVQLKRGKKGVPGKPTLDDDALNRLARKEPLVKPLVNAVLDCRTLGKFLSNFLLRSLSEDGRMRCSYRIGGSESGKTAPKTFRLASAEDAFGSGTNLQNIPSEHSKSVNKAANRGAIGLLGDPYTFPNIREIFIPDPGHVWFDLDLERADLFVVVYEADDKDLKTAMHMGVDMHLLNAFILQMKEPPPYEELIEGHNRYDDHRGRNKGIREFAKTFIHGTNYLGTPRTMAANTGRTVRETERAQHIWFGAHPGIRQWHVRVEDQVRRRRYVENKLGYRWYIFDRIESVLTEAVAWIPQSTVAVVINKIWARIFSELPDVQVLLQVHDSLCGQCLTSRARDLLPELQRVSAITVPYEDPLVIPCSIKTSTKSWGDCK